MKNLTKREDIQTLVECAQRKEHLDVDSQTVWVLGLAEAGSGDPFTLLVDSDNRIYKSRLSQRKVWLEKEKYSAFSQAVIKASFHDCRGKSQHRFPYLFRDAVFVPIDGPSTSPDTMWFNLLQIKECRKLEKDTSATVLTMRNGKEWIVPRTYRYLREQIEEVIAEYLTFTDLLAKMDYTSEPLYLAEANLDQYFLSQCYYRVRKRGTNYDPEKILLSMAERKVNGNRTPKWVLEAQNKQKREV